MVTTFLSLNTRNGPPQASQYVNASPVFLGNPLGASQNNNSFYTGNTNAFMDRCSILNFEGAQTFYSEVGGVIYQTTDGGVTWSSVHVLNNLNPGIQSLNTGLWIQTAQALTKMSLCYQSTLASQWYVCSSLDGTTWNEFGPFTATLGTNFSPFCDIVTHRNKLYIQTNNLFSSNAVTGIYDPSLNTINFAYMSGLTPGPTPLCSFNNKLYGIFLNGSQYSLWELQGTNWIPQVSNFASITAISDSQAKFAMFDDGAFMWAFLHLGSGQWACYQFDSSLTVTDFSSIVPTAFNTPSGRIGVLVDGVASPGTAPVITLYWAANGLPSTPWQAFQWNSGSALTFIDSGGSAADSMPFIKQTQGSSFWAVGQDSIDIIFKTAVLGGLQYSFKLYSNSGTDSVTVQAWFANATSPYPVTAATLSNPSSGTLVGNTVTGLIADNTTIYQVTWQSQIDGINPGQFFQFVMEQS